MSYKRRIAGLAGTLATVAAAVTFAGAPAQASVNFNEVHNAGTGKCLDLATENNTIVHEWHCSGGDEQHWLMTPVYDQNTGVYNYEFVSQVNNQCLAVNGDSLAVGAGAIVE